MRATSTALSWTLGLWLGLSACSSAGGVQALSPVEGPQGANATSQSPTASDYSAHLDLLALGYHDGSFEVRSPAPQHVLSRGQHDAAIENLALTADGQRLATVDRAGVLAVSEIGTGDLKVLPSAPSTDVGVVVPIGLAWDHAGKRLAVTAAGILRVIEVDSGKSKQANVDTDDNAVAFSKDDRELAIGGKRITLHRASDLRETRRLPLPTEYGWQAEHPNVLDLRYSPDGSKLGALLDVGVALFDLKTGQVEAALVKDLKAVGLRFASDGRLAVFARDALYIGPANAEQLKAGVHKIDGTLWDVEFRRDDTLLFLGDGINADEEALLQLSPSGQDQ
jgi:WD40 repeat protein